MKYKLIMLLLCAALYCKAQSPVVSPPQLREANQLQVKKDYHAATMVELSGVVIAFVGGSLNDDPAGRGAFIVFGSSIALGGLFYSLFSSSPKDHPARQFNERRMELEPSREGVGIKMRF